MYWSVNLKSLSRYRLRLAALIIALFTFIGWVQSRDQVKAYKISALVDLNRGPRVVNDLSILEKLDLKTTVLPELSWRFNIQPLLAREMIAYMTRDAQLGLVTDNVEVSPLKIGTNVEHTVIQINAYTSEGKQDQASAKLTEVLDRFANNAVKTAQDNVTYLKPDSQWITVRAPEMLPGKTISFTISSWTAIGVGVVATLLILGNYKVR